MSKSTLYVGLTGGLGSGKSTVSRWLGEAGITVVDADRRMDGALLEMEDIVRATVAAVLIVNGYHTHKRQWRRMAQ